MKKSAYLTALVLFIACIATDLLAFLFGQPLAGITLTTSTLIVFFSAHVWYVHHPEPKLRVKNLFLVIPMIIITLGFLKILSSMELLQKLNEENLLAQGQVLMSRYQGGLWILGLILLCAFIFAASILERKKA